MPKDLKDQTVQEALAWIELAIHRKIRSISMGDRISNQEAIEYLEDILKIVEGYSYLAESGD